MAISTIQKWKKQLEVEGNLKNKPLNRGFKKINPEKLQEYIKKHPDAYLKEIAQEFNCSDMAVHYALKRLKITRKKNDTIHRTKSRKGKRVSRTNQKNDSKKNSICG